MSIVVYVQGDYGLFTDPMIKSGGEKFSYPVPTYEACRGIMDSIYFKPSIVWVIDRIRVLNPIQYETKSTKLLTIDGPTQGHQLAYYTYLRDVAYVIEAHFEFVEERTALRQDFDEAKHTAIAHKSLKRGGRRDVYLGVRECQAYVEPCKFFEHDSFYKGTVKDMGSMFVQFDYGEKTTDVYGGDIVMNDGVIDFRQVERKKWNTITTIKPSPSFSLGENMTSVEGECDDIT